MNVDWKDVVRQSFFAQSGAVSVGPCPSSVNNFQCVFLLYDTFVNICSVRNVFTEKILISVKNND
jgi:hypothetical protein